MIYEIAKYGEAVLEQAGAPVTEFDDKLRKLVEDMFESMYAANGVGLAAAQIGLSLQLAVIDLSLGEDLKQRIVLANPEIIETEGEQHEDEGCLSLPGFSFEVTRPVRVKIRAQDIHGEWQEHEGKELLARALCHEIDHLSGTLYIHHLSFLKRDRIRRKIRKLRKAGEW